MAPPSLPRAESTPAAAALCPPAAALLPPPPLLLLLLLLLLPPPARPHAGASRCPHGRRIRQAPRRPRPPPRLPATALRPATAAAAAVACPAVAGHHWSCAAGCVGVRCCRRRPQLPLGGSCGGFGGSWSRWHGVAPRSSSRQAQFCLRRSLDRTGSRHQRRRSIAPSPALSPCRRVIFASPVASARSRAARPPCPRASGRRGGARVSTTFHWARSIEGGASAVRTLPPRSRSPLRARVPPPDGARREQRYVGRPCLE